MRLCKPHFCFASWLSIRLCPRVARGRLEGWRGERGSALSCLFLTRSSIFSPCSLHRFLQQQLVSVHLPSSQNQSRAHSEIPQLLDGGCSSESESQPLGVCHPRSPFCCARPGCFLFPGAELSSPLSMFFMPFQLSSAWLLLQSPA